MLPTLASRRYAAFLSKSNVALFCIFAMLIGFLVSRAVLSVAMVLMGANALRQVPIRQWLAAKWWWLGLGWIALYALSWFWSQDKAEWNNHVQVKLPFLLLPLSFFCLPKFTSAQMRIYTLGMNIIMLSGIAYSLSFFFKDPVLYKTGYDYSHLLPTPVYRDHISFSAAIATCFIWLVYFFPKTKTRTEKTVILITAAVFAVYLHILAAKTGLVILYIFFIGASLYLLFRQHFLAGLGIVAYIFA